MPEIGLPKPPSTAKAEDANETKINNTRTPPPNLIFMFVLWFLA